MSEAWWEIEVVHSRWAGCTRDVNGLETEKVAGGRACKRPVEAVKGEGGDKTRSISAYYCGQCMEYALEENKTKKRETMHAFIHLTNI